MFSTRRNGNVKKPSLKRKHRTRKQTKRKRKGGTYSKCMKECTDKCYDEWEGLPTKSHPTNNGWFIRRDEDTIYGITYMTHYLHNNTDPAKSVSVLTIPKRDGTTINLLDAFKTRGFDLPILGYISREGYALSIDNKKLVWKRGHTLIPYVYDEEPTE